MPTPRLVLLSGLLLLSVGAATPKTIQGTAQAGVQAARGVSAAATVVVDPGRLGQTFVGWGTSLAWWANAVGGWSAAKRNRIADLLFDPARGLGLNVVRYNLGADDGHNACAREMRPGANIPSFSTGPGRYDWSRDARQRFFLEAARARGANVFEAFANSAPAWMLRSGCTAGTHREAGVRNAENLAPAHYDDYARYLAAAVKHFADQGLTFRTVEPFNEASSDYWYWGDGGGLQEGMNLGWQSENALLPRVRAALDALGMASTGISAADNNDIDYVTDEFNSFSRESQREIVQINAHAYKGSQRAQLAALAREQGKRLWMSEFGCCGGDRTPENQLDAALSVADSIRLDLSEMRAQAWVYWQAVEHLDAQGEPNHNWGLIKADFLKGETFELTKEYAGFGQYSRFIRPGMVLVLLGDPQTLAAYDAKRGTLAIVALNSDGQGRRVSYDLRRFAAVGREVRVSRTSLHEDLSILPTLKVGGNRLNATLAARSITSFLLTGVRAP